MIDYRNNGFKNRGGDLDITNRCTLQCPTCMRKKYNYKTNDIPGGDLSLDQWEDLTDYFSALTLNGTFGDPIFNPNFIKMLRIAYMKDVDVSISNAASQKPKQFYIDAFLAHPKAHWRFGIDGLPYQSFAHRINQDGEHLFEMMKIASQMGLDVSWQYIVFSYNEDKVSEAIEMSKQIGVTLELNYSGRDNGEFLTPVTKKHQETMTEGKEEFRPKCLSKTSDKYLTQERMPFVTTSQQVIPCCWVDEKLDWDDYKELNDKENNLNNNKIEDILNGKILTDFYDKRTNGDIPEHCRKKCSTKVKGSRVKEIYVNGKLTHDRL